MTTEQADELITALDRIATAQEHTHKCLQELLKLHTKWFKLRAK